MHVDPTKLTPDQKLGLWANIERVKAQQTIHLGNYDLADYRGVYRLWLTAYGDRRMAEKAQSQALDYYVERQCNRGRA